MAKNRLFVMCLLACSSISVFAHDDVAPQIFSEVVQSELAPLSSEEMQETKGASTHFGMSTAVATDVLVNLAYVNTGIWYNHAVHAANHDGQLASVESTATSLAIGAVPLARGLGTTIGHAWAAREAALTATEYGAESVALNVIGHISNGTFTAIGMAQTNLENNVW